MAITYLLLADGASKLFLADGSSFLLLDDEAVASPAIPGRAIIWREPSAVIWREPAVTIWREP